MNNNLGYEFIMYYTSNIFTSQMSGKEVIKLMCLRCSGLEIGYDTVVCVTWSEEN